MSADDTGAEGRGLADSATDLFLRSTHSLIHLVAQASNAGAKALTPEPVLTSAGHFLQSLRDVVEEVPQIGDELDVLVGEIGAKRLTIQSVIAELSVLDTQLEILERTLGPIQDWSVAWGQVRHGLLHSFDAADELGET